jgi:photosystem II stability/assembly factor-like uncharacterized protein
MARARRHGMAHSATLARITLAAGLVLALAAPGQDTAKRTSKTPGQSVVVQVRSDRIVLLDIAQVGQRLMAVGERGFTLVSTDAGSSWKGQPTVVTRTLTGIAFKDDRLGIAVGHGGSIERTEDGGSTWSAVTVDDAGSDSLLGVTWIGEDHFVAYGAFGLYFDSRDAGRTWTRVRVLGEDFDRHISQVVPVGQSLFLVAESGTLARSDDAGATWKALTSPYQGSFFGALAPGDGSLLVFGMRGNLYRSTDLGETWRKVELGTTVALNSGRRLHDGRLLIVGNNGLLVLSRDGGQTFEPHFAPLGKTFAASVETQKRVILAGESGITPLDPAWLAHR